jgi:NTP pyrophosphatase (non-canonical NTP hydrolase)
MDNEKIQRLKARKVSEQEKTMPLFKDINAEAALVHARNRNWWINIETGEPLVRNHKEMLFLAISELSEAHEGWRKKNRKDDKLPHLPQAVVELADCAIRLLDYANGTGLTLDQEAYEEVAKFAWAEEHKLTPMGEYLFNLTDRCINILSVISPAQDYRLSKLIGAAESLASNLAGTPELFAQAYRDKMEYNRTRKDHSIEHRLNDPEGKLV